MGWMRATIPGAPEAPRPGALHARGRAPQDIECTFDARLGRIIDPHLAKGQEFSPSETRWRSTTREELVPKGGLEPPRDRKSTRLNSSHGYISYAVFCLKKKKKIKVESH